MYLHLGNDFVVRFCDIVGVYDIETSTISKHTRGYLAQAEKNSEVINVSSEMPKSFIVCFDEEKEKQIVYISQISTATLKKRLLYLNNENFMIK